ncbi:hypothetical protein AAZX31_15G159200 [Glycine max]
MRAVILVINFLQVVPHLCCSGEWFEIEDDIRLNKAYDPSYDLCIFDLPFGMCLHMRSFVRSRISSVNMTPLLLAFDKDLELECPGGVVLSIKTNKEDIIFFSRHDVEKKITGGEKTRNSRNQEQIYKVKLPNRYIICTSRIETGNVRLPNTSLHRCLPIQASLLE